MLLDDLSSDKSVRITIETYTRFTGLLTFFRIQNYACDLGCGLGTPCEGSSSERRLKRLVASRKPVSKGRRCEQSAV